MAGAPSLVFRRANRDLVEATIDILNDEHPMTLRSLFYQLVSAGHLPSTAKPHYQRLAKIAARLREGGEFPMSWIVDHVRTTLKPSSWSGLSDFAESVRQAYRKDFWADQPTYVEIFVEKDAIAGCLQPITHEYDVALRVCRGYASIGFAGEIATEWQGIEKPIVAYYIGDHDPSGHDIERDLKEKLGRYSGCWFDWQRIAVMPEDIEEFSLLPLEVKAGDTRAAAFIREHGGACVEVDALAPTELRTRVEQAITRHIDADRWARLQRVEAVEQQTIDDISNALIAKTETSLRSKRGRR